MMRVPFSRDNSDFHTIVSKHFFSQLPFEPTSLLYQRHQTSGNMSIEAPSNLRCGSKHSMQQRYEGISRNSHGVSLALPLKLQDQHASSQSMQGRSRGSSSLSTLREATTHCFWLWYAFQAPTGCLQFSVVCGAAAVSCPSAPLSGQWWL